MEVLIRLYTDLKIVQVYKVGGFYKKTCINFIVFSIKWLSKFNGFSQLMQGGLGWQSDCMEVLIGLYTDLRIVPESFKSELLNPQKMAI